MREILFRGKRVDNGEWVCSGNLIHFNEDDEYYIPVANSTCTCTHDESDNIIAWDETLFCKVAPETIGQYTGLTDKNGKKIFEDDIVKVTDDNGETNLCSCGIGYVCFYDGVWYICDEVNDGLYDVTKIYYVEIIGNIHDNPEFLKGE